MSEQKKNKLVHISSPDTILPTLSIKYLDLQKSLVRKLVLLSLISFAARRLATGLAAVTNGRSHRVFC